MNQSALPFLPHSDSRNNGENEASEWAWKGVLRGLLWRLRLGVLPSSSSIEQLRRAAADGRRRYADLRRRLLIDPHAAEDPHKPHQSKVDNPLSQDPESLWSRYFQIAELEETIDTDLTRLYPEHGQFFQSPVCQAMLRRILLVWSLMNTTYSYRQGMHELLAPLLYVLYCDVMHFHEVKQRYEDLFDDRFEEPFYVELKAFENEGKEKRGQKFHYSKTVTTVDGSDIHVDIDLLARITCHELDLDEVRFALRIMVLGNDTYGAEGELGILLAGRFVEHDAYSMFDALMCGNGGVNMADYFLANNVVSSTSGLSSALEVSSLIYKALAAFDLPLYNHLKGLGVEPQFFALRWIRVLFGREFDLKKLLILWDAIFLVSKDSDGRKDFILALSVSMVVYLRWIMIATSNATDCLQKLLNFPQNVDIEMLIESAKILAPFIGEVAHGRPHTYPHETMLNGKKTQPVNKSPSSFSPSPNKFSPDVLRKAFPESYWEEKWKNSVLQKLKAVHMEDLKCTNLSEIISFRESKQETNAFSCNSKQVGSSCELLGNTVEESVSDGLTRLQFRNKCADGTGVCYESSKQKYENHDTSTKPGEAMFVHREHHSDYKIVPCDVLLQKEVDHVRNIKHEELLNDNSAEGMVFMSPSERNAAIVKIPKEVTSCSPNIATTIGHHTPCQRLDDQRKVDVTAAAFEERKYSSNQKKSWIWSFGKGRRHDDKGFDGLGTIHLKEGTVIQPGKEANLVNKTVDESCVMIPLESDKCVNKDASSLVRLMSEFVPSSISSETTYKPSDARMIGRSICENIQVIEDVLSLALISETTEGPYVQPNESPVSLFIDGSQHEAVQTALAELKKISNSLLRM